MKLKPRRYGQGYEIRVPACFVEENGWIAGVEIDAISGYELIYVKHGSELGYPVKTYTIRDSGSNRSVLLSIPADWSKFKELKTGDVLIAEMIDGALVVQKDTVVDGK